MKMYRLAEKRFQKVHYRINRKTGEILVSVIHEDGETCDMKMRMEDEALLETHLASALGKMMQNKKKGLTAAGKAGVMGQGQQAVTEQPEPVQEEEFPIEYEQPEQLLEGM